MAPDLEVVILIIGIVILPFASLGAIFVFSFLEAAILAAAAGLIIAHSLADSGEMKMRADRPLPV